MSAILNSLPLAKKLGYINDLIVRICSAFLMSYTELEYGYQGLRKATRPTDFYVGVSVAML